MKENTDLKAQMNLITIISHAIEMNINLAMLAVSINHVIVKVAAILNLEENTNLEANTNLVILAPITNLVTIANISPMIVMNLGDGEYKPRNREEGYRPR